MSTARLILGMLLVIGLSIPVGLGIAYASLWTLFELLATSQGVT